MTFKKAVIFLFVFLGILVVGIKCARRFFPVMYEEAVAASSEEFGVAKELLLGVIFAESRFSPGADSGKAAGLMQITEDTAIWISGRLGLEYSSDMRYDPEISIRMGSYYLSYLIELYGNVDTALAAYNAGGGRVSEWLKDERYSSDGKTLYNIPYGETKRYIQRVKKFSKIYDILY